jgi:hypothetical protein
MSRDAISSAICDSLLLDWGTWDEECRRAFSVWIRSDDFEERRLKASELIAFLIEHFLGDQISVDGRVRARRLAETLVHLEDLLITARSGIGKKFYRDHLNHMLRVALLANAIASKAFPESQIEVSQLIVACLFHDIAYPLAESRTIIDEAIDAMETCYRTLVFPHLVYSYSMDKVANLVDHLPLPSGFRIEDLGSHLEHFAHSIVGGIEFLDYVRDNQSFGKVLEAIVFHDSHFKVEINLDRHPLLTILVIADELQDWGRPIAFQEEALIPELGNLKISSQTLWAELDYARESSLSPFRQAGSKLQSLRRLNLGTSELRINIRMILPHYDLIDLGRLGSGIAKLWNPSRLESVTLPSDAGQEWFMQRYYGTSVSQATHSAIMKGLGDGTLEQLSPLTQFDDYLNRSRTELVLVNKQVGRPNAVDLRMVGNKFSVTIQAEHESSVQLCGAEDTRWKTVAEFLAEEMRIFSRLSANESVAESEMDYLPRFGDFLARPDSIRPRLTQAGFEPRELAIVDELRNIRNALSEGGLFIIDTVDEKGVND